MMAYNSAGCLRLMSPTFLCRRRFYESATKVHRRIFSWVTGRASGL